MKLSQKNFVVKYQMFVYLIVLSLIPNGLTANEETQASSQSNDVNDFVNLSNDNLANLMVDQEQEQRANLKSLIPYLYEMYLDEQLAKNHADSDESSLDDESSEEKLIKRGLISYKLSKKESPAEQRSKDLRRQQAARWDIGFGKRASNLKSKSFMDALYGKRSGLKHINPKVSFGRKQQWDIQYGRR